ncbi:hypothetical protein L2E82_11118 [Cichorium intybus]|uniref:Uncharacterized protein n=1 Tax=Cichorium intybus TaxID=13427 RepID=A0ACB9GCB5_CICIN|nr:hypothetical protein L2E82_11118 [Cichorium intybus]
MQSTSITHRYSQDFNHASLQSRLQDFKSRDFADCNHASLQSRLQEGLLDQCFSILWSSPTTLNPKAILATTIIGR